MRLDTLRVLEQTQQVGCFGALLRLETEQPVKPQAIAEVLAWEVRYWTAFVDKTVAMKVMIFLVATLRHSCRLARGPLWREPQLQTRH